MVYPEEDESGEQRSEAMDMAAENLGLASRLLHAAQLVWEDVDAKDGEDDYIEDDEGDEDE
jgi:hypothetical protein